MSTIAAILSMHAYSLNNPLLTSAFEDACYRIRSMCTLYDKLCSSDNVRELSVKSYLEQIADDIIKLFPKTQKIVVKKELEEFNIDTRISLFLGIIINELITNIMKHAFIGREDGQILIATSKNNNNAAITIQDNGIGFPDNSDIRKAPGGFGMNLVRLMMQHINGEIKIESVNGTKIMLDFPINN